MDNQSVVYSYDKILLNNKKDQNTNICNIIDKSQKYVNWNKPSTKQYVKYDSIPMKSKNRENKSVVIKIRKWFLGMREIDYKGAQLVRATCTNLQFVGVFVQPWPICYIPFFFPCKICDRKEHSSRKLPWVMMKWSISWYGW